MCDFAYPSIPYLKDMKDYDPKKVGYLYIEEKFDGANIGISFNDDADIVVQNRGGYLMEYTGQFRGLKGWLRIRRDELFDLFSNKYMVFGEWLYHKHNVHYNNLVSYFIVFDIYDKKKQKFLAAHKRNEMLHDTSFVHGGSLSTEDYSFETLERFIDRKSRYGDEKMEGLIVRKDRYNSNLWKAKVVRKNFLQPDEKHWKKKKLVKNIIRYGGMY